MSSLEEYKHPVLVFLLTSSLILHILTSVFPFYEVGEEEKWYLFPSRILVGAEWAQTDHFHSAYLDKIELLVFAIIGFAKLFLLGLSVFRGNRKKTRVILQRMIPVFLVCSIFTSNMVCTYIPSRFAASEKSDREGDGKEGDGKVGASFNIVTFWLPLILLLSACICVYSTDEKEYVLVHVYKNKSLDKNQSDYAYPLQPHETEHIFPL